MTDVAEKKRPFETYDTTVSVSEILTPRVKRIRFQLPAGASLNFKAGQFIQLTIPNPEKPRRTSYSIASPPHEHTSFELCVTHVEGGVSSTYLHALKVGDHVHAMGPLGKFTLPDPLPRDPVFIATGSGIAPFRSMIFDLLEKKDPHSIHLVFGNRFENDIIYRAEWDDRMQRYPNFRALYTLSRPDASWKGETGYVQDKIEKFIPSPATKDFYICGLVKMIEAVSETLLRLGVPQDHIHYERYD